MSNSLSEKKSEYQKEKEHLLEMQKVVTKAVNEYCNTNKESILKQIVGTNYTEEEGTKELEAFKLKLQVDVLKSIREKAIEEVIAEMGLKATVIKEQKESKEERKQEDSKKTELQSQLVSPSSTLQSSNLVYVNKGDLLNSRMQTLVNAVNCIGVMGKGIAYTFKIKYPEMFKEYKSQCDQKKLTIGKPCLYKASSTRWILNFPTKNNWREASKLEYIEAGLKYLVAHIQEWGITSLAIPPLGCGNGGLNWEEVKPILEKYLKPLGIPMEIYAPTPEPYKKATVGKKAELPKEKEEKTGRIDSFFKSPSTGSGLKEKETTVSGPRYNPY